MKRENEIGLDTSRDKGGGAARITLKVRSLYGIREVFFELTKLRRLLIGYKVQGVLETLTE